MKEKRAFESHLVLSKVVLNPGAEWTVESQGWSFILVSRGVAYWLHPRANYELTTGSALLISDHAPGLVRASQLGEVLLHYFRLLPGRLGGLFTWGEQRALEKAASQPQFSMRAFAPAAPVATKFKEICVQPKLSPLLVRTKLLEVFVEALGDGAVENAGAGDPVTDAKERLIKLLNEAPASELLELSFGELVQRVRCTPRHMSRIFHELVGISFREKQAQLRLLRAQELLATTETKVVDVALESGYRSLSLFNLMFKRRFGMTPAKWRDRTNLRPPTPVLESRVRAR